MFHPRFIVLHCETINLSLSLENRGKDAEFVRTSVVVQRYYRNRRKCILTYFRYNTHM